MKRPTPWTTPGYRFYTPEMSAWMGGYIPTAAAEDAKPAEGKPATTEALVRLTLARAKGAAQSHQRMAMEGKQ